MHFLALKVLAIAVYTLSLVINFSSLKNLLKDLLFWLAEKKENGISLSFLSLLFNTKSFDYKKRTLLHIAVIQGDSAAVRTLLKNEADINARDYQGNTVLHLSAKNIPNPLTVYLMKEFSNLLLSVNYEDDTPQNVAAKQDNLKFLRRLSFIDKLYLRMTNLKGETILHTAVKHRSYKTAIFLLEKGADHLATDNEGNTPFHLLHKNTETLKLTSRITDLFLQMVKTFFKKGLNPQLSNKTGDTPKNFADKLSNSPLKYRYLEVISNFSPSDPIRIDNPREELEEYLNDDEYIGLGGLDNPPSQQLLYTTNRRKINKPPLHLLVILNHDLSNEENLKGKDRHKNTPLHAAVLHNSLISIESLLKAKVDLNLKNAFGSTPLHLAVIDNKLSLVIKLIKARADINAQNNYGNTALHIAAKYHFIEIVKFLLESKADTTIRNKEGETPEDLAGCSLETLIKPSSKQVRKSNSPSFFKKKYTVPSILGR